MTIILGQQYLKFDFSVISMYFSPCRGDSNATCLYIIVCNYQQNSHFTCKLYISDNVIVT